MLQTQVVAGLSDALTGWRKATKPAAWDRLPGEAFDVDRPEPCECGSAT